MYFFYNKNKYLVSNDIEYLFSFGEKYITSGACDAKLYI